MPRFYFVRSRTNLNLAINDETPLLAQGVLDGLRKSNKENGLAGAPHESIRHDAVVADRWDRYVLVLWIRRDGEFLAPDGSVLPYISYKKSIRIYQDRQTQQIVTWGVPTRAAVRRLLDVIAEAPFDGKPSLQVQTFQVRKLQEDVEAGKIPGWQIIKGKFDDITQPGSPSAEIWGTDGLFESDIWESASSSGLTRTLGVTIPSQTGLSMPLNAYFSLDGALTIRRRLEEGDMLLTATEVQTQVCYYSNYSDSDLES